MICLLRPVYRNNATVGDRRYKDREKWFLIIRVVLPHHLRTLAKVSDEVQIRGLPARQEAALLEGCPPSCFGPTAPG
jgi:hypothetical protein